MNFDTIEVHLITMTMRGRYEKQYSFHICVPSFSFFFFIFKIIFINFFFIFLFFKIIIIFFYLF